MAPGWLLLASVLILVQVLLPGTIPPIVKGTLPGLIPLLGMALLNLIILFRELRRVPGDTRGKTPRARGTAANSTCNVAESDRG